MVVKEIHHLLDTKGKVAMVVKTDHGDVFVYFDNTYEDKRDPPRANISLYSPWGYLGQVMEEKGIPEEPFTVGSGTQFYLYRNGKSKEWKYGATSPVTEKDLEILKPFFESLVPEIFGAFLKFRNKSIAPQHIKEAKKRLKKAQEDLETWQQVMDEE